MHLRSNMRQLPIKLKKAKTPPITYINININKLTTYSAIIFTSLNEEYDTVIILLIIILLVHSHYKHKEDA